MAAPPPPPKPDTQGLPSYHSVANQDPRDHTQSPSAYSPQHLRPRYDSHAATQPLSPVAEEHKTPSQGLSEYWVPDELHDKSTTNLSALLSSKDSNQELITALTNTHPALHPSASPLPPLLNAIANLATHLKSRHDHLLQLRNATQDHLLRLHALERAWRDKQAQLDRQLSPWSAKSLYMKFREGEREGEDTSAVMEATWLAKGGGASAQEVEEWIAGWKEGRVKVHRRREFRKRWDEGRVGGWR